MQRGHVLIDQMRGHGFVGQKHELLDQAVSHIPLSGNDVGNLALVGEDDLRFRQVEIDRPAPPASGVENLEEFFHLLEHRYQRRVLSDGRRIAVGENRIHCGVGHPRVAVDDAVVHLVAHDRPARVHFHQARLHQPVHVWVEAAQAGGEGRRKHVHGTFGEIDGGPPLVGFLVERRALSDVVRHVRDVYAEPVVAIGQACNRDRVVEVTRMLTVNRYRRDGPKISAPTDVLVLDGAADSLRLGDGVWRMGIRDAEFADDDLRIDTGLVDVAEHFDHTPNRAPRRGRPARNLHQHHLARFGRGRLPGRHVDIGEHTSIEGHDEAEAPGIGLEATDDGGLAALQDAEDLPLESALGAPLDAHHHPVSMHGFGEVARRNVDVLPVAWLRVLRHHKPEAPGVCLELAHHQVHLVRQPEPVAANLEQFAVGDERLEVALEGHALVARELEQLRQFTRGRGMVHLLANEAEDVGARNHGMSTICKSPTFVRVGPVLIRLSSWSKKA